MIEEEEPEGQDQHDATPEAQEQAKVLVRMPEWLRLRLKEEAGKGKQSVNSEIVMRLLAYTNRKSEIPELRDSIHALRAQTERLSRDVERMSDIVALLVKMKADDKP